MLGKAMDFYIPGVKLATLREIGMQMQIGGVGFYPTSGSPFVHMDVGGVRAWPRMSRQELVRIFPKGNTLHVPSDGKPLPGYEQALADYKKRVSSSSIQVASSAGSGPASSGGGGKRKTLLQALLVVVTRMKIPIASQRRSPQSARLSLARLRSRRLPSLNPPSLLLRRRPFQA